MDYTLLKIPILLIIIFKLIDIIQAFPYVKDILDKRILVNFLLMFATLLAIAIMM